MKLKNRVVLVTGAAQRLGKSMASALAQKGAHVAFSYRHSAQEAKDTQAQIEAFGVRSLAVRADLAKETDIRRLFERIRKTFGRLDVLVNSAANFHRTPFAALSAKDWDLAMNVNARGPFLCAWHAGRLMQPRGGKIINFADWSGIRPYKDYLPYCVSKAAVIGLTKALAKELAPKIQVNAIAPGPILPPEDMSPAARARIASRVPLKRWGTPEDIVNTLLYLIEGTEFTTGSVLFVDGGQLIA